MWLGIYVCVVGRNSKQSIQIHTTCSLKSGKAPYSTTSTQYETIVAALGEIQLTMDTGEPHFHLSESLQAISATASGSPEQFPIIREIYIYIIYEYIIFTLYLLQYFTIVCASTVFRIKRNVTSFVWAKQSSRAIKTDVSIATKTSNKIAHSRLAIANSLLNFVTCNKSSIAIQRI